jgi:hypothetical protein
MTGDLKCPADDGVDWGAAGRYLKRNEAALVDLMAKVDDLMVDGAVYHAAIVEHPERETPAPESAPAGADVPVGKDDIVKRLRGTWIWSNDRDERLRNEAADEIARLRAEVERLTGERDEAKAHHVQWVAEVDADLTEIEANMDRQDAERAAHIAALAQRVAEAVRGACAERGHSLWYDAESECGPSYTSDGIRALDLGPIVAAALAKDGE